MAYIELDKKKCTGCKNCERACAFGCITFFDKYPIISEDCRLCKACIQACKFKALSLEDDKPKPISDKSSYKGILVFAEQKNGKILDVTYELIGKAREMSKTLGEEVSVVLLGHKTKKQAKELIAYGADKVYLYDDPRLENYRDDPYAELITKLIKKEKPGIFLIGATAVGRILAPRISMKMWTGLTADCTKLEIDPKTKLLLQTRPAFGGNIMATITCENKRPQMATVRPKVMEKPLKKPGRKGQVIPMETPAEMQDRVKLVKKIDEGEDVDLAESDIIVVGGRGVERKEGFDLLKELAGQLGGAVGASRPPVEEGWISYAHQIGLSGKTVRPKLYIACGISGAVQHMAGMETSDYIISINKDPEAPIFKISDLGVVGDLYSILPEVIEKLKNKK